MPFLRAAEPAGLRQVHDKSLRRDEKEEGFFSPADPRASGGFGRFAFSPADPRASTSSGSLLFPEKQRTTFPSQGKALIRRSAFLRLQSTCYLVGMGSSVVPG